MTFEPSSYLLGGGGGVAAIQLEGFFDKCIPKPFISHYSLNTGPSTKMVIFNIYLRQIYNAITFEPYTYL